LAHSVISKSVMSSHWTNRPIAAHTSVARMASVYANSKTRRREIAMDQSCS